MLKKLIDTWSALVDDVNKDQTLLIMDECNSFLHNSPCVLNDASETTT